MFRRLGLPSTPGRRRLVLAHRRVARRSQVSSTIRLRFATLAIAGSLLACGGAESNEEQLDGTAVGGKADDANEGNVAPWADVVFADGYLLAHQGEGVAVLGGPRNVARLGVTVGHCTALLMRMPGRSLRAVLSRRCTDRGSPGGSAGGPADGIIGHLGSSAARQLRERGHSRSHHASAGRPSRHAEI